MISGLSKVSCVFGCGESFRPGISGQALTLRLHEHGAKRGGGIELYDTQLPSARVSGREDAVWVQ